MSDRPLRWSQNPKVRAATTRHVQRWKVERWIPNTRQASLTLIRLGWASTRSGSPNSTSSSDLRGHVPPSGLTVEREVSREPGQRRLGAHARAGPLWKLPCRLKSCRLGRIMRSEGRTTSTREGTACWAVAAPQGFARLELARPLRKTGASVQVRDPALAGNGCLSEVHMTTGT